QELYLGHKAFPFSLFSLDSVQHHPVTAFHIPEEYHKTIRTVSKKACFAYNPYFHSPFRIKENHSSETCLKITPDFAFSYLLNAQ
ncbi:hypothetical protein, partial [Treponema sp.]|uniref:hypothetical protein n=1 Tax=Treponema sp. TaxID=166 RepID=UPI00388D9C72